MQHWLQDNCIFFTNIFLCDPPAQSTRQVGKHITTPDLANVQSQAPQLVDITADDDHLRHKHLNITR